MKLINKIINNEYFIGTVTLATILYASCARPKLPTGLVKVFEYPLIKVLVYSLIVFLMTHNLQVAIVVSIAFYVFMNMLNEHKITEGFMEGLENEAEEE